MANNSPNVADPDHSRESAVSRAVPIYYALLGAILTVVALFILWQLQDILLLLFVSLLFAAATAGPAAWLERFRVPRGIAVALIYFIAVGFIVLLGWFVLPPLFNQIADLGNEIPTYIERYEQVQDAYEGLREQYPELESFEAQAMDVGSRIVEWVGTWLTTLPSQLFAVLLDVLSVFVISLLLVTTRHRLLNLTLSLVHPDYREQTQDVGKKMWNRLGHYLRAKLIVMAIVGLIMYFALLLIGVPFAVLLAIVVALGQLIPRVGPWLARIPLLSVAALEGWMTLGLVLGASIVIENIKGYVISPVIEGKALDIHPLFIFIAVLVGSSLFGLAGAFVAVPAAAMVQVLFEEVVIPWRHRQLGTWPADKQPPVQAE